LGVFQVTHPIWISTVFSLLAGLIFSMQALSSFQGKGSHFKTQNVWLSAGNAAEPRFNLAQLEDAAYQFCSEPEPQDWRQGAGVCFWFKKSGNEVVGIYGYPHTGRYVDCISGSLERQSMVGEAVAIASSAEDWPQLPRRGLTWDDEGHLRLGSGKIVHREKHPATTLDLVHFRSAVLNLRGFYRYSSAKVKQMPTLPKTCDIVFWKRQTAMMLQAP
jgi:hypothetical protein